MARDEIEGDAVRRRESETSEHDDADDREPAERERSDEDGGGPWAKTSSGDAESVTDS